MAFSTPTQINLDTHQRAARKLLLTVVEWQEGSGSSPSTYKEILGRRTEDSSLEYNGDVQQSTDILGINYADLDKTQPSQSFDPYLVLGGSRLAAILCDVMQRNALTELNQFTVYIIEGYRGTTGQYEAVKHVNCSIIPTSLGGDANVNMPITLYLSNELTTGTVNKLAADFEFSADA